MYIGHQVACVSANSVSRKCFLRRAVLPPRGLLKDFTLLPSLFAMIIVYNDNYFDYHQNKSLIFSR